MARGEESDQSDHEEDAPIIVALDRTTHALSERASVITIIASVVDPDGLDDIVGGLARDTRDDALVGAFIQVSSGTFELTLAWSELERVGKADGDALQLAVTFTDAAGSADTRELELPVCREGHDACPTECVPLDSNGNCGACGATCWDGFECTPEGECCYSGDYDYDGDYDTYCEPPVGATAELPLAHELAAGAHAPFFATPHEPSPRDPAPFWQL